MKPPTPPRGSQTSPRVPARPRASSTPANAELERALVLRDVMDHAVRVQREITAPKRLRISRLGAITTLVLCVLLLALSAYSWVARPELIWGRGEAAVPAAVEAGVRFAMLVVADRLEARRRAEGRYPASFADSTAVATGIAYRVTSDTAFELRATVNRQLVLFHSSDAPDAFLRAAAPARSP